MAAQQPQLTGIAGCIDCPPPAPGRRPRPAPYPGPRCHSHRRPVCIDCPPPAPGRRPRPATHPGPRCATHARARRIAAAAAAHDRHVVAAYDLDPGEYPRLIAFQGGRCPICKRATGRTKRLAVDHDHATGRPRGACCGPCNDLLAHCRDDLEMLQRAINYLRDPPVDQLRRQASQEATG